ncbi:cyclase family protein [Symbioplanes lichenis]|uniref:cyclase family protein n=1 Tax=Symbioplanes lichenis TaxID=1629072 RepID=UPI002739B1FE|nr:cyclase family protein [Actinoplanes lichenis]
MALQYRAEFDADVTFEAGGTMRVRAFSVDVPHEEASEAEIVASFAAACRLPHIAEITLTGVRVFAEPHLDTPGGPWDGRHRRRWVELSHVISEGLITYPGLPAPVFTPHLTRADSRSRYAEGTEFAMDLITMLGNTGTYLDSPFHRYADGSDLAGIPLERLADLPAVVVRAVGRAVDAPDLDGLEIAGHAVLLHTGGDKHWSTPAYAEDAPYLTEAGARLLVERGAALVGIDAINIDDASPASGGTRPAHTLLLAAGIPVVEHLTGLGDLPPTGARFTAAPPRVAAFGTFPVRAYASVPDPEPHDHSRSAGWQPAPAE